MSKRLLGGLEKCWREKDQACQKKKGPNKWVDPLVFEVLLGPSQERVGLTKMEWVKTYERER